jgi:hypothetical protein
MNGDMSLPASRLLSSELTNKVRERGIVVWLDSDNRYTDLADGLRQKFDFRYPVVSFKGSYLELMLALKQFGNGLHPEHLLVHLPGLNKETIKETPLFELYKAGTSFEKNLQTLVREAAVGRARPEEVEAFLSATSPLTLSAADQWLESLRADSRDQVSVYLDTVGLDDVILDIVSASPRLEPHLTKGADTILDHLAKHLGISAEWRHFVIPGGELNPHNLSLLVSSWLMAVEFVEDLKEPPVMPELQALAGLGPFGKECHRLVTRLRQQEPQKYTELVTEVQDLLVNERTSHHAAALGSIDTFRFEEATIRAAVLGAIERADWASAQTLATERTPERCFWVKHSLPLQRTWELLRLGANLGQDIVRTQDALKGCASLEEAVERYTQELAPIDRGHRLFEQRAHALLAPDLDDHDALLEARVAVRRAYRAWADAGSRVLFDLCRKHGALPDRSLRQRAIYQDVVQPLLDQGGRLAFILVDALRFEMAQALGDDLQKEKYRVSLSPRLAELPTITAVGMNALAPVERDGRLEPVLAKGNLTGFRSIEFVVSSPATRLRAISQRSLQDTAEDIELEDFQDLTLTQLKRRLSGKPPLIAVRSRELDTAGEHNLHLGSFDHSLALIKSALSLLAQAGVERFVIVSDHGFLLQDLTTESIPFGVSKRVPDRRHALLTQPSGMPDVLEIPLSDLEYELGPGTGPQYLVLRPDTAVWQTAEKIAPFAHGGNSLQERVIPVLILERPGPRGKTTSKYEVVARAEPGPLGRQKLKIAVRLQAQQSAALSFAVPRQITLALRVPGRPDVSVTLLDATPPALLGDGRLSVPPNREEATVEFMLEGPDPGKVRIEVYHPDAKEDVAPKTVEEFFEVVRDPKRGKVGTGSSTRPPSEPPPPAETPRAPEGQDWHASIADEGFRKAFVFIEQRRTINEAELETLLGNSRRVRAFSRAFDTLVLRVPFVVELGSVQGLKTYSRRD